MTLFDPANPAFQGGIGPFLLVLLLVGGVTVLVPAARGTGAAVALAGLGPILTFMLTSSWASFPPPGTSQKMGYLIILSAGAAWVLVPSRAQGVLRNAIVYGVALLGIWWVSQSMLGREEYLPVILTTLAALIALFGFLSQNNTAEAGALVVAAGLSLGLIALLAPSASITLLGFSMAASAGGFLLWTWPTERYAFVAAGVMALVVPLIWLSTQGALYTNANDIALALLVAIPFVPRLRARFITSARLDTATLRPVVSGMLAGVVGVIAVAIAYSTSSIGFYTG